MNLNAIGLSNDPNDHNLLNGNLYFIGIFQFYEFGEPDFSFNKNLGLHEDKIERSMYMCVF